MTVSTKGDCMDKDNGPEMELISKY